MRTSVVWGRWEWAREPRVESVHFCARVVFRTVFFCWCFSFVDRQGRCTGACTLEGLSALSQKVSDSPLTTAKQRKGLWASTRKAFEPPSLHPKRVQTLSPNAFDPESTTVAQATKNWHKQSYSSCGPKPSEARGHKNLALQADQYNNMAVPKIPDIKKYFLFRVTWKINELIPWRIWLHLPLP